MELIIGCLFIAAVIQHAPAAIQDLVVAWRASKAGEWDWLDKEMARRSERDRLRAERRAALAAKLTARRERQSGDPGRPGVGALVKDVYHGACEDALAKRQAKRAAAGAGTTAVADGVDQKLQAQRDRTAAPDPLQKRHCPECGEQLTRSPRGWQHQGGTRCPAAATPGPTSQTHPATTTRPRPHPRAPQPAPNPVQPTPALCDTTRCPGCPDCRHLALRWTCNICGATSTRRFATDADVAADYTNHRCNPPTAPTPGRVGTDTQGDKPMPVDDVQTNEAARRAFTQIAEGAAELAEAAAMAERARAKMAAAAQAAADGMSGIRFDAGATSAANEAVDAVGSGTLADWCEKADAAKGAAESGLASLDKYRDAEDVIAANEVDARTLANLQS